MPLTNVTMLVHNRPELTLQALRSMGLPQPKNDEDAERVGWSKGAKMNLTVFPDGCKEETLQALAVHRAWTETEHWMHTRPSWGTGIARNNVIAASEKRFGRGDYLYLSDNDVFFLEGWLDRLIDCYESAWSAGCRALGGVGHPYHQLGQVLGVCSTNVRYAVHEVMAQPLQSMLMRWEVWDKYGPFNKTTPGRVCDSEDVEFCRKIHADGFKVGVVSPALIVNTGITNSFGQKIPGWELVKAQCPSGVLCE